MLQSFSVAISRRKRKALKILDEGITFYPNPLKLPEAGETKEALKRNTKEPSNNLVIDPIEDRASTKTLIKILARDEIISLFEKFWKKSQDNKIVHWILVELSKRSNVGEDRKTIPTQIFNVEFHIPELKELSCVSSTCIPFLSSSMGDSQINQINFAIKFKECCQGGIDFGVSFTDIYGNLFYGMISLITISLKDQFIQVEFPKLNSNEILLSSPVGSDYTHNETLNSLDISTLYYFYIKEILCKIRTIKVIRLQSTLILRKYYDYLQTFQVHSPYETNDMDITGLKHLEYLNYHNKSDELVNTLVQTAKKTICRVLIRLPAK